ncbi:UDP-glycosyltransferase 91A1 isoform X1 [Zea mays]|uniref:Uncharacterized protein n=1 Tax=Zea mays TaxID=4577 RepID=A0A804Q7Y2_MAIZE|nr:UDP-glycosyltransferase 91A1 isoform X1 [Zea mays]|eukprot:XP_020396752.1 UDP-glycosyltransferase 91A1 isoform X1 [Zea mays]
MITFLDLSKRLARRGHAVTFVSTPRNAAKLQGSIPLELAAHLCIVRLDLPGVDGLPEGAESTADVLPKKVGLLQKAFDGLAAPFERLAIGAVLPPARRPRSRGSSTGSSSTSLRTGSGQLLNSIRPSGP